MVASSLWISLRQNLDGASYATNWMKNLITLPIVLFQPTIFGLGGGSTTPVTWNGTRPQPGLKTENYLRGSNCESSHRAIPGQETVIAYACIAGLLLLCVVIAKLRAYYWERPDATEYPLLDYEALIGLVNSNGDSVSLIDRLKVSRSAYEDKSVLDAMENLNVRFLGA